MRITKKAISVGVSAALLASLVAVVVAPATALADYSTTGAVTVGAGGTSATAPTFIFNDASSRNGVVGAGFCALAFPGSYTIIVTLADADGNPTITFSGTPTIVAPASLGASVSALNGGNSFTVTITGCDPNNTEQFSVTGLKIVAGATAAVGTITATITGTAAAAVVGATTTATGTLASAYVLGSNPVAVTVTSACHFSTTGSITVGTEAATTVTAVTTNGSLDTVTLGVALTQGEALGTAVTETGVPSCGTVSPGSVVEGITQNAGTPLTVYPGENNQATTNTSVVEDFDSTGVLLAGTVLTFTLPAGVTFSHAPIVTVTSGTGFTLTSGTCALAFTLQSCSVTVDTAATALLAGFDVSGIQVDVASTVANGASVTMTLTTSVPIDVTSNIVAYVNRVLVGVAANAVPTVYIGYNGQQSGSITIQESAAAFFQSGSSGNNQFMVCISNGNGDQFMFAPWAIVTAGNVSLLNTSTNLGVSSVAGSLTNNNSCATWYIYSASTIASTIVIVGANASGALPVAATNGPTLSVNSADTPGPVIMTVTSGSPVVFSTQVTNAIRAFKSGIVVTAASQPYIAPGTTGPAGNITFAETLNGQLFAGDVLQCFLVSSAKTINPEVYISTANSNDLPVVTTNTSSGLIAHLVPFPENENVYFAIAVDQQAVAPNLGTITVSNLHYTVVSGTEPGPVTVECAGGAEVTDTIVAFAEPDGGVAARPMLSSGGPGWTCVELSGPTLQPYEDAVFGFGLSNQESEYLYPYNYYGACPAPDPGYQAFEVYFDYAHAAGEPVVQYSGSNSFDAFVSNAIVGSITPVVVSASGSGGVQYSLTSRILKTGQKITVTFKTSPQLAGTRLAIWLEVRPKGSTSFGALKPHASVTTDVNGVAMYQYTASAGVKVGFVAQYAGNSSHAGAMSYPVIFGAWTK